MRAASSARRGVTEQGSATSNPAPAAARPPGAGECLSPLDASFLYLERPTELLHVGAVAVLEAPPAFEALRPKTYDRVQGHCCNMPNHRTLLHRSNQFNYRLFFVN